MNVSLREITADTVRQIIALAVTPEQQHFVASNAVSLAQALFCPEAWYRAIYADDEAAGFVMLYDETLRPSPPVEPKVVLWRFMIDARFQGKGIGAAALARVIEHLRARPGVTAVSTSYVPGPGCPEPFYRRLGFEPTGEIDDGEVVLRRALR